MECWTELYTDVGDWFGLTPPDEKASYTRAEVISKPDWFEPVGKVGEFYPKFPSLSEFFDRESGHFSGGDTRHNNMCRICQLLNKLDNSKELEAAIYNAYKSAYESEFK